MKKWTRLIALVVLLIGVVNIALGITFISIGVAKQNYMTNVMKEEKITLGIPDSKIAAGEVIDTMGEAQAAGDVVRGHRHGIAPTYGDLLGGEKFNPGDPKQLSYAQAMNIENYLYLATASFGITYLSIGAGVGDGPGRIGPGAGRLVHLGLVSAHLSQADRLRDSDGRGGVKPRSSAPHSSVPPPGSRTGLPGGTLPFP